MPEAHRLVNATTVERNKIICLSRSRLRPHHHRCRRRRRLHRQMYRCLHFGQPLNCYALLVKLTLLFDVHASSVSIL